MNDYEQNFDKSVEKAVEILAHGSKNKFCGILDITTSHLYQMTAKKKFSANLALQIEHLSKGAIRALDLCPMENDKNGDIENDNTI